MFDHKTTFRRTAFQSKDLCVLISYAELISCNDMHDDMQQIQIRTCVTCGQFV